MALRDYARALGRSGRFLVEQLTKANQGVGGTAIQPLPFADPAATRSTKGGPRSAFERPLQAAYGFGWKERVVCNAFEVARELTYSAPVIGVIISTRANECLPFTRRSLNRFSPGFRVVLRDEKEKPTKKSQERAKELERFVEHTGDPETSALRDSFTSLVYKVATDSLMFAQFGIEIVPDRSGRPAQFYAVDASTLRIAQHAKPYETDNIEKEIRYVQVVDGRIVTAYTHEQLIFAIRNPSTDVRMAGYGISELEKVQRACSAILDAWQYNVRAFTQGTNIRGIINIREPMGAEQFEDFREDLYRWTRGVDNAHGTTVMNSEQGFDYTDLSRSNRDLEYGEWTNFLIRIICSEYNMATDQIGFNYGNVGQDNALGQNSNEWKITQARERGLRPLLDHIFSALNHRLIYPLDENFRMEYVGLDQMTPEAAENYNNLRVRTTRTINELRAEADQEPLPDGTGDIILDPTWLQNRSMQQMQQQQAQQAAQQQQFVGDDQGYADSAPPDQPQQSTQQSTDGGQDGEGLDADAPDENDAQKSFAKPLTWRLEL